MDLSKFTELELRDLRMKVEQAIVDYANRQKQKVYTVFIEFIGTKYYLQKENAIQYLKDCIEEGFLFDGSEAKCHEKYLTQSEVEQWCEDYSR